MVRWLAVFAAFALLTAPSEALNINASDGVSRIIDASDLISGAGSDLRDTYESASDATSIDISNCTSTMDAWRVDVSRSDVKWHSNFTFYLRRASDGSGQGIINGGFDYQEVTFLNNAFFSGEGNRQFIYIQYKLAGESLQIPVDEYRNRITFTVVDI